MTASTNLRKPYFLYRHAARPTRKGDTNDDGTCKDIKSKNHKHSISKDKKVWLYFNPFLPQSSIAFTRMEYRNFDFATKNVKNDEKQSQEFSLRKNLENRC